METPSSPAARDPLSCAALPLEVLALVVSYFRRDLSPLSRCAAAARGLLSRCEHLLWRAVACRRCGLELCHPSELCQLRRPCGRPLRCFADGPTSFARPAALRARPSAPAAAPRAAAGGPGRARALPAGEAALGRLRALAAQAAVELAHGRRGRWRAPLECPGCGLFLGEVALARQPFATDPLPTGGGPGGASEGVALVCASYLRMVDSDGPCGEEPEPLCCSGARRQRGRGACGNLLADRSDVLSEQHCWCPPGGDTEGAWYINGFAAGAVVVGPPRAQQLAQGRMEVADVSCAACGGSVGWQFARDLSRDLRNRHQVGRFGLCLSSVRARTGEAAAAVSRGRPRLEYMAEALGVEEAEDTSAASATEGDSDDSQRLRAGVAAGPGSGGPEDDLAP